MRDKELPNDILSMFEAGIDIALVNPIRTVYDDDIIASTDIMADNRVQSIMGNVSIRSDRREAFAQQTRLGWTKLFQGYMTENWRISTEDFTKETKHKWTAACSRLLMEWGRACWSHRNNSLHGPSSKRNKTKRIRLQAEVRVWMEAPSSQSLVSLQNNRRSKSDISKASTETIENWLLHQQRRRKRIRAKKTTSILTQFIPEETLLEADREFQMKIIEARRGAWGQLEPNITNEEPPD